MLPTAGGAARRLTDHHLGAGAPVWSPDSRRLAYAARVPEEGRYGTVEGVGPERRAAAADHHPAVPAGRRRLPRRPAAARSSSLDLPEDFADDTAGRCRSRSRSPPATPTAPTSPGAPTAASSPSCPPGTRAPTATWSATSTPSGPDGPGLRRVTDSRGDCAVPAYDADRPHDLRHRRPRPRAGRPGLRRPAGRALPGGRRRGTAGAAARPRGRTIAATRRRRPSLDDGGVLVGVQRRGAVELLRVPLDGGAPEALVDGAVHRARASRRAAGSSSPSSPTTGRRASSSRSRPAGGGC